MFMGIFRSKLSPVYWLIRGVFGKDLAKTSDIDEASFRMCIVPGAGYELKNLVKEGKGLFVNILGVDKEDMEYFFQEYSRLAMESADAGPWTEKQSEFLNFRADNLIFEVTEEQHDQVTKFLSGKKIFKIMLDDLARIREMAEWEAKEALRGRTLERFKSEAIEALEQQDSRDMVA